MDWNHRVVRVLDYIDEQGNPHYTLTFAEVYYNDDGTPMGHAECFMHGDDLGGLRQLVNRLGDAINQEILEEKDMRHVDVAVIPDSDEDIFEANPALFSAPNECRLCGRADKCEECK